MDVSSSSSASSSRSASFSVELEGARERVSAVFTGDVAYRIVQTEAKTEIIGKLLACPGNSEGLLLDLCVASLGGA